MKLLHVFSLPAAPQEQGDREDALAWEPPLAGRNVAALVTGQLEEATFWQSLQGAELPCLEKLVVWVLVPEGCGWSLEDGGGERRRGVLQVWVRSRGEGS